MKASSNDSFGTLLVMGLQLWKRKMVLMAWTSSRRNCDEMHRLVARGQGRFEGFCTGEWFCGSKIKYSRLEFYPKSELTFC
jgi:hypothetical protein